MLFLCSSAVCGLLILGSSSLLLLRGGGDVLVAVKGGLKLGRIGVELRGCGALALKVKSSALKLMVLRSVFGFSAGGFSGIGLWSVLLCCRSCHS